MIAVVTKESQRLWKAQFGDKNAEAIRYFPHIALAIAPRPYSMSC
jgi:hypothetical protein